MRDLRVSVDLSALHGNSDRPAHYHAWIVVAETALPLKGTWHRRASHDESAKPLTVCNLTSSELWRLQGFNLDNLPKAIPEADFVVPSQRSVLTSNDCRRNLTDQQETAQWLSGDELFQKLLTSLFGAFDSSFSNVFTKRQVVMLQNILRRCEYSSKYVNILL